MNPLAEMDAKVAALARSVARRMAVLSAASSVPGPRGPAGRPGATYRHIQSSPSAEWTVNHGIGLNPSVAVLSPGGVEVSASVIHQSLNQLKIYFAEPQSGFAHCV